MSHLEGDKASETLVMACNESYALAAACALYSLGVASPKTFKQIVILGSGIPPKTAVGLENVAREVGLVLEVRDASAAIGNLDVPVSGHISKDTWTRLFIPDLCPDLDQYVYGDADLLYIGSLDELATEDLGGNIMGAVPDIIHTTLGMPDILPGVTLGEKERKAPYFNSGVLLVDANAWREADVTGQALRFAQEHPDSILFWDQDALNAVLIGKWKQLDRRWNTPPVHDLLTTKTVYLTEKNLPKRDIAEIEDEAKIIHFMTPLKPWLPGYPPGPQFERYQQTMKAVGRILAKA